MSFRFPHDFCITYGFMGLRRYIALLGTMLLCGSMSLWGGVKFIPNTGQWRNPSLYKAQISSGELYVLPGELRYQLYDGARLWERHHLHNHDTALRMHNVFIRFTGADTSARITTEKPSPEFYNYFLGNDPTRFRNGIHAVNGLRWADIYPHTELHLEAQDDAIKYTWTLAAGADPKNIAMHILGAEGIEISQNGNLRIHTSLSTIEEQHPYAYQILDGRQREVGCQFKYSREDSTVRFSFPDGYDESKPLIIDPTVIFATFSGSKADNFGFTGTYDSLGTGYSGGTVYDFGFPVTAGALQKTFQGGIKRDDFENIARDAGFLKYSPDGSKLLYATYLGGKDNEQPHSMVVDGKNNLLIFGTTYSKDFPVTKGAYDTKYDDSCDIFIVRFSGDSSKLLAGTYIGGTSADGLNGIICDTCFYNNSPLAYNYGDHVRGEIISDAASNVYVATSTASKNFPGTSTGAQSKYGGGPQDGIVFKMNEGLTKLIWSSYAGGKDWDAAYAIQRDTGGNLFITGGTQSDYFFPDTSTYQHSHIGSKPDAWVAGIKSDGSSFLNSTYIGTKGYEQGFFVQIDQSNNIYIFGQTDTPAAFPLKNVRYYNKLSGQFITKFNHNLDTLIFSGMFGGGTARCDLSPSAFLVDNCGKIYVSGWGGDVNSPVFGGHGGNVRYFPVTKDAFQKNTDGSDFWVAVFARDMDTLLYSSFFGGTKGSEEHVDGGTSRFDKRGVIYQSVCGGCGGYSDFPTTVNAWSRTNKAHRPPPRTSDGGCNNLLFKVNLDIPDMFAEFDAPHQGCYPYTVQFVNRSYMAKSYFWDFGDGSTSTASSPKHTFTTPGIYNVKLVGYNIYSCAGTDTVVHPINAYDKADARFKYTIDTCASSVHFDNSSTLAEKFHWFFGDSTRSEQINPIHRYPKTGTFTPVLIVDSGTKCADTFSTSISIRTSSFNFSIDSCTLKVKISGLSITDSNLTWIFDSTEIFDTYPDFTFLRRGNHTIRLIVRNTNPCDTITKNIFIPERKAPQLLTSIDSCARILSIDQMLPADSQAVYLFNGKSYSGKLPLKIPIPDTMLRLVLRFVTGINTPCQDTFLRSFSLKARIKTSFSAINDPCTQRFFFKVLSPATTKNIRWSFGDGSGDSVRNVTHTYSEDTLHSVRLIVNAGLKCADTARQDIQALSRPLAKFSLEADPCNGLVTYTNLSKGSHFGYIWTFGDGSSTAQKSPTHVFSRTGRFVSRLIVDPKTNCADTFELSLQANVFIADSIILPNIISPNGDGLNDCFRVAGPLAECLDYELLIFNRWGQELYHHTGTKHEWCGLTPGGNEAPAGTYFYILRSTSYIKIREGTITVVR